MQGLCGMVIGKIDLVDGGSGVPVLCPLGTFPANHEALFFPLVSLQRSLLSDHIQYLEGLVPDKMSGFCRGLRDISGSASLK